MPKRYRKLPVEIEAGKFKGPENADKLSTWITENGGNAHQSAMGDKIYINTLEGQMTADTGDFVIKGVKGEFYPCKPDIFKATYELVEE